MKKLAIVAAALILVLAFVPRASSATRDWSYALPEGASVLQLITDDVGGAAFSYESAGATYIVWLDSKGRPNYQKQLAGSLGNAIVGVNNRALVIEVGEENKVIVVERNGIESSVPDTGNAVPNPNKATDLNGFCAVAFDPSSGAVTALVRYSY